MVPRVCVRARARVFNTIAIIRPVMSLNSEEENTFEKNWRQREAILRRKITFVGLFV